MGHRLLGFGITLIMDYMDNRYKSCDYGRFFGFKITTSKKQKVLFDYLTMLTPPQVMLVYQRVHTTTYLGQILTILVLLVLGNGWVAGGCWDDDITSDDWDHSRKFSAFSTRKL